MSVRNDFEAGRKFREETKELNAYAYWAWTGSDLAEDYGEHRYGHGGGYMGFSFKGGNGSGATGGDRAVLVSELLGPDDGPFRSWPRKWEV